MITETSASTETQVVFHDVPPVIVIIIDGRAKLQTYLTGFDIESADPSEARALALAIIAASDCVELLNSAIIPSKNGG